MYTFDFINKQTQFGKDSYSMIIYFDSIEVMREETYFNTGTSQEVMDAYANSKIDYIIGEI